MTIVNPVLAASPTHPGEPPPPSILDQRFVLPDDVLFVPIEDLVDDVRSALAHDDGDHAVTRPGFRTPARLVDADTSALLRWFRPARTIVDAVVGFATARGLDPEVTLVEAFSALQVFSAASVLVLEDSPDARGLAATAAPGQRLLGFEILATLQCTRDTEVYRARAADGSLVALKLARPDAPTGTREAIAREARVLDRLAGAVGPRLIEVDLSARSWLAVSWIDGVPIAARAAELRLRAAGDWRERLLTLVTRLVESYAALHRHGVAHGDVHSRNLLVTDDDQVVPIDFGMARIAGGDAVVDHPHRVGLGALLDPQAAACLLAGERPAPCDPAAEQYAVAALAYELVCGAPICDFAPDSAGMYRQIVDGEALPFTRRGFEAWPAVEAVLRRGLAHAPTDRYPDLDAFARALGQAAPPRRDRVAAAHDDVARAEVDRALDDTVRALDPIREVLGGGPVAGLDHGAAGLAWCAWRLAELRDDPELLAHADVWAARAEAELAAADAWHHPADPTDSFVIDDGSVLHRASGVALVRARIAIARGDRRTATDQLARFLVTSAPRRAVHDVTLGAAGALIAAVGLAHAAGATGLDVGPLRVRIASLVDQLAPLIGDDRAGGLQPGQPRSLAHGWVGVLGAVLTACRYLGRALPDNVVPGLLALARPAPTDHLIPGWCNGAAGHALVLVAGHAATREPVLRLAAERAAEHAFTHPDRHAHLCCGLAGRTFALLTLFRHTADERWLAHARHLARALPTSPLPAEGRRRPASLFWGRLGAILALEETRYPHKAMLPVFAL